MQLSSLLLTLFLFSSALSKTTWKDLATKKYFFEDYVKEFSKVYDGEEYNFRKSVFESNLETILAHNANPSSSWKMGVNHMADWTNEEFNRLLGYKRMNVKSKYQKDYVPAKTASAAPSVDWRQAGIISTVKDQGQCGSCWSFGTAETVESYYALKTGQLPVLSEQQILDCTPNPNDCGGSGGCEGGTTDIAYEQIIKLGGLSSEWTYPYVSYFGKDFTCHFLANTTVPVAQLSGFTKLPSNTYQPVIDALANGPLAINVDASSWGLYETGVFTGCNTTDVDIDHVVQLVGYGTDPKLGDYWLIRNSWTPAWGEAGYIRLVRSSTVQCAPDTIPQDGTGCNGGPSVVTVCGACGVLYDVSFPTID